MRSRVRGRARDRAGAGSRPVAGATGEPDWCWPPYAPVEVSAAPFDTPDWAPSSVVRHPLLRVGRWTVLYRRSA